MTNVLNETRDNVAPMLQTPITDAFAIPNSQQGQRCGWFEEQFYRCLEAYGTRLGRKYCDLEHRDFKECMTGEKQTMRADAIRKERIKQYLRGERKEVFEKNHTPPGSYEPDFFSHVKRTN